MVMSEGQVLSTAFGRVLGDRVGGVLRYRGVPFAGRLDGAARWMPPSWPEPWDGVRPALVNAAPVPQNPPSYDEKGVAYHAYLNGPRDTVPVSEEGLFLNLWTPSLDPQARRPIMIYIHGGGFELGSPSSPRTQGDRLAAAGDVVVISAAHRLNVPGYLYLDEISGGKHRTANLGLLDLVHLLHWVADHASAFGGDADNVTLFGESGGGMKISALTMMPAARGLFRRGICQAGVMAPPARTGARFGFLTPAQATERSLRLIRTAKRACQHNRQCPPALGDVRPRCCQPQRLQFGPRARRIFWHAKGADLHIKPARSCPLLAHGCRGFGLG